MTQYTAPELSDVIVRGRKLGNGEQLDPPGEFPAIFSCRYNDTASIGCVFLNGAVLVMPNRCHAKAGPIVIDNFRALEESSRIADITFEWTISRIPQEPRLHTETADEAENETTKAE